MERGLGTEQAPSWLSLLKAPSSLTKSYKPATIPATGETCVNHRFHRLVVDEESLEELIKEALKTKVELCGFLLGHCRGEEVIVERFEPLENAASSPVCFEARAEDILRAHLLAEELGLEVVGIYHSHPAPPSPSSLDLKGMERWPLVWLIVSSLDGSVGAFQLIEGSVTQVEIVRRGRGNV